MKLNDKCPKCGYDWDEHEFAVPEPYCPSNDEDVKFNKESGPRFKKTLEDIKSGKFVSFLKGTFTTFVIQNEGCSKDTWFDYQTGFRSYEAAKEHETKNARKDLKYRIIKREVKETVIK